MKYIAPEMEMKALEIDEIIMSTEQEQPPVPGELPDEDC